MKVVIVGGVAGGATCAARLRRLDEHAEIVVYERSGYVSYANCGLPYYIGGEITDKNELTLQTPQSFKARFNVEMKVHHEVTAIDAEAKTVTVRNLETDEEFTVSYDKLLLSPGAKPVRPNLPGIDSDKIFTLRTVEDTFKLKDFMNEKAPRSAVLIGGGFVGLELAENLVNMGLGVTLVELADQVMAPLDYDMACQVHGLLRNKGVDLHVNTGVSAFEDKGDKIVVKTQNGKCFETDMVVLSIGVVPESTLAKDAGLELGVKGSILVNEHMETSKKDIYAVGDAVETVNFVTGKAGVVPLAGPANKQARIAADNMCGIKSTYKGVQGTSVAKAFEMTVASTGINEKAAKAEGIDYDKAVIMSSSHAGYYPGAKSIVSKALFEKGTGKVLGAQIAGYGGVDKRIDVYAMAIRAGMTVYDLRELDLAYAPPYSSAKDPVNMMGYVMENVFDGRVKQYHWDEVDSLPNDGSVTKVDVRTRWEYDNLGYIEGALHIPVDEFREHLDEIPKDKPVYVNCQSGLRSYIACRTLSDLGYECYNLSGGYGFYAAVKKELARPEAAPYPCGMEKQNKGGIT